MTNIITEKLEMLYFNESHIEIINEYYTRDIQRLDNLINEGFIQNNLDKITNSYNKNIDTVKKVLLDRGINVNRVKNKSLLVGKTFKNDIKNREKPEIIQKKIINSISKIIKEEAISAKKEFDVANLGEKITSSVFILLLVLIISSILGAISVSIFGSTTGTILIALVIAPFIEEYAKRVAIIQKYPWIYTGIFSGFELLAYTIGLVLKGGSIVPVIIIRLASLLMHFATTYVQKFFREKEGGNEDQDVDNMKFKTKMDTIGYFLGLSIHILWNTMALLLDKKLLSFIGLK